MGKSCSWLWAIVLLISVVAAAVVGVAPECYARKQRLRLPSVPKVEKKQPQYVTDEGMTEIVRGDSLFGRYADGLQFTGYDKRIGSNKETFFITNNGTDTIAALTLTIRYRDMENRELHSRDVELDNLPLPGATRKTDIKSWDPQKTFYYYRSQKPRVAAVPYKVSFSISKIALRRQQ